MIFQKLSKNSLKYKNILTRLFTTGNNSYHVERLDNRSLIRISGNETEPYLQGLITNDVTQFQDGSDCMYTMFLNSKGRVLYDAIIYKTKTPETYFIECDKSALIDLKKHLMIYKLRKKLSIDSVQDGFDVWVIGSENSSGSVDCCDAAKELLKECIVCPDPRIVELGLRIIAPKDVDVVDRLRTMPNFEESEKNFYKSLRYRLGVGEGVAELPPGNCFPLESNCDYLHGVSFHKGCYMGQELTARVYHTGVVRKRIMPIVFQEEAVYDEEVIEIFPASGSNKSIGKLRGVEGNVGIGLLRIKEALDATELKILDKLSTTSKPTWWPIEKKEENLNMG